MSSSNLPARQIPPAELMQHLAQIQRQRKTTTPRTPRPQEAQ